MNHSGGGGGGGEGGGGDGHLNRGEAERWLEIAARLLQARDLVGGKRFAERALEVNPLVDGVDEILAVADVLIASETLVNDQVDWYSVLQLDGPSSPDLSAVKQAYRRLALRLQSDKNRHAGADRALQIVTDAWNFLSDPDRKRLLDEEIKRAANSSKRSRSPSPPPAPESFWTMCPTCYRAYEYEKVHQGRLIRCQSCKKPFQSTELPSPPPIVPGTDCYYCSWGLYPLGFPGCPMFNGVSLPPGVPHFQLHPQNQAPSTQTGGNVVKRVSAVQNDDRMETANNGSNAEVRQQPVINAVPEATAPPQPTPEATAPPQPTPRKRGRPRKVLAQKPRNQGTPEPETVATQPRIINFGQQNQHMGGGGFVRRDFNVNAGTQNVAYMGGGFDMNSFAGFDAASEVLGNLAHLPFLKDDEVVTLH